MDFNESGLIDGIKYVAEQKGVAFNSVISAVENVFELAGRKQYGNNKIKAKVDPKNGTVKLFMEIKVVNDEDIYEEQYDEDERRYQLSTVEDARLTHPEANIGDVILRDLPPLRFERSSMRSMRQMLILSVEKIVLEKQYRDYKDHVGEILCGNVARIEASSIVVNVGGIEVCLPTYNVIKGEVFKNNDRVRACISEVRDPDKAIRGQAIVLSRVSVDFVRELFRLEVPEIYDGIVRIMAIARDPGSHTKVAVFSSDSNIDPVGACVGVAGVRVQAIISELRGEKIDIVQYSEDIPTLAVNALSPAKITKVIVDEEKHKLDVVVNESQLSKAIGKRGQNVRLASEIIGWRIDIIDEQKSEESMKKFGENAKLLVEALNIDEIMAQLLVMEGFSDIRDINDVSIEELSNIEGFDDKLSEELISRASDYLKQEAENKKQQLIDGGVSQELIDMFDEYSLDSVKLLADAKICSMEGLADLAVDELIEIVCDIDEDSAKKVILSAREKMGWI